MSVAADDKNLTHCLISPHNRIISLLGDLHHSLPDRRVFPAGRVEELRQYCLSHFYWEEEYIFPLFLEKVPGESKMVEQLKTEHNRIRQHLFRNSVTSNPDILKIENLRWLLGLHFDREEMILIPKMEANCSQWEKEEFHLTFESRYELNQSGTGFN